MRREIIVDNEIQDILTSLRKHYRRKERIALYKLIYKTHPAVMSDVFRHLTRTERIEIFRYIRRMKGLKQFLQELDDVIIEELFTHLKPGDIAKIFKNLPAEDIVDILELIPESLWGQVQSLLDREDREEVKEIQQYPDESAGRIMSTRFVAFNENLTVRQAIDKFQELEEDTDAPFYIYVVNDNNQMVGVLSLRQLLLYPRTTVLKDIMQDEFIAVSPETDQEEVAEIVSQYNYLAVPVLEKDNTLVGVITVEDVVDIIREEATEDILKMAGAGDDREILQRSTLENARIRFPWLMASWIGGVLALSVIGAFESLLEQTVILAAFIPVIMGMGGNVGTQTSSIIIRGIATDRVNLQDVSGVIIKQIMIGLILGTIYGLLLGLLAYFRYPDYAESLRLGLVVGISILSAMTLASCLGALYPILLDKFDFDPAISSGPFVTTSIDILSVLIYFFLAGSLLNL